MNAQELPPPSREPAAAGLAAGLWFGYFLLMLALTGLGILMGLNDPLDLLESVFHAFALIALWGWLRGIAIGTSGLWRGYLALLMLSLLLRMAWSFFQPSGESAAELGLVLVIVLGVNGPLWYALWHYGFRSDAVWQSNA